MNQCTCPAHAKATQVLPVTAVLEAAGHVDPWVDALANVHRVVLLEHPSVGRITWMGEAWSSPGGRARAVASVSIESEKDASSVDLEVRICQDPGKDPYAYVEWAPIKKRALKFYKRLEAFGLFKSINQKGGRCGKNGCKTCKNGGRHVATSRVVLGRLILAASGVQVFGMECDHMSNSCGASFGGFDTLDNRRAVLQALTPMAHRQKPRIFRTSNRTSAGGSTP